MTFPPIKTEKASIFGEGAVHPMLMGCVYGREAGETSEHSDWKFQKVMESLGLEWQPNGRQG